MTFDGIVRPDGRIGTRNYLGVLTSVNCSATVAKLIARQADRLLAGHPRVDGVVALTHGTGCGLMAAGEGLDVLRRTLRGYAAHPNFAGIVAIGLGCEVNQLADLDLSDCPTPVRALSIQDAGGTAAAVRAGLAALAELLPAADAATRRPVPVGRLVLGLKLCSNPETYARMSEDMDINCGTILSGRSTVEEVGRLIFDQVVAVASGRPTASELLGFGDEEFTPWQLGAVL